MNTIAVLMMLWGMTMAQTADYCKVVSCYTQGTGTLCKYKVIHSISFHLIIII